MFQQLQFRLRFLLLYVLLYLSFNERQWHSFISGIDAAEALRQMISKNYGEE